MKRRQFVLLLGAGGAAASSVGSGAFSSVEAERGVEVNVVEDKNAYVGIERVKDNKISGEGAVAEITNQFAAKLHLTVELVESDNHIDQIRVGGENVTDSSSSVEFDIGDHPKEVSVKCDGSGDHQMFTLELTGQVGDDAGTVKTKETFSVRCESSAQVGNNGRGPPDSTGSEEGGRGRRENPGGSPHENHKSNDDETGPSRGAESDDQNESSEEDNDSTESD